MYKLSTVQLDLNDGVEAYKVHNDLESLIRRCITSLPMNGPDQG